jgi:[ribosomal protein S18]-alanine N-acetyltransferase
MIAVRKMISADVAGVFSILQESPEASMWSEEGIEEVSTGGTGWVAEQDGVLAGFLIARLAADEFEILNMAVGRVRRRNGIGGQLVKEALNYARMSRACRAHLEVRASNQEAMRVYIRHGFALSGRRGQYYQHPAEDALLFTLELKSTEN